MTREVKVKYIERDNGEIYRDCYIVASLGGQRRFLEIKKVDIYDKCSYEYLNYNNVVSFKLCDDNDAETINYMLSNKSK